MSHYIQFIYQNIFIFTDTISSVWKISIASADQHSQQIPSSNTQEGMKKIIDYTIFNFKKPDDLTEARVAVLNDRLSKM